MDRKTAPHSAKLFFKTSFLKELLFFFRHPPAALFAENVDIEDLKDAERVHDKKDDEPDLAVGPRRFPEREAFPDDAPDEHRSEQEAANPRKTESRHHPRAIEHISEMIHGFLIVFYDLCPFSAERI